MTQDPPRLLDSTSGGSLQRLLRAGRSELPDDGQLRALEARLGPIVQPPPDGGSGGGPDPAAGASTAAGTGLTVGAKVAIGAGLLAAAIGVVAVPSMRAPSDVQSMASAAAVVSSGPLPTVTVITTQTREAIPSASVPPASRDVGVAIPTHSSPPTASASAKPAVSDPVAEARLLQRAQDALAGNPAQALSLCGEHAKRYPGGILSQEREIITIQAMAGMGRLSEAKARAEQFRRAHPRSAYLRRIATLLEPGVAN